MSKYKAFVCVLLIFSLFSISHAEIVSVEFHATLGKNINHLEMQFNDALFMKDSDSYDHQLACLSLGMAVSAFRSETVTYIHSDSNIRRFFEEAGFENYAAEQFEMIPTAETIATAIASKQLTDGSILIAVAISGQGYKNEWLSNFAVGGDEIHQGFREAASIVYDRLMSYIEKYVRGTRIRIWTAGFSRAAAIANLLASQILQGSFVADNDVFAYTFGTPSTTKTPIAYPQIFNICNSFDPVAFIPFSNWRYQKHGITKYLPAEEDDLNYSEKAARAKQIYGEITQDTSDLFRSNVNANWLLSKIMELLYRVMPESAFYSAEFQQTLIETWVVEGSAINKLSYLVRKVMENSALMEMMKVHGGAAETLLADGFYNAFMEISGRRSGKWADLFADAVQLIHEHLPEVYLSWMMSTNDPEELFDHPTSYTRMILSGDFDIVVYDSNGEQIKNKKFSRFTLNDQVYYSIPDGDYSIVLTPKNDSEGIIALRYHDIRSVSEVLYETEKMHFFSDEQIKVSVMQGGEYSVYLGEMEVSVLDMAEDSLCSIAGELTLTGSNGVQKVTELLGSMLGIVIPHALALVLILLYLIFMLVFKLVTHAHDELVDTHAVGRRVLILVSAGCMISAGRHLYFLFAGIFSQTADLENRTAIRISELFGMGTSIYQLTDVALYSLLSMLAWRGRRRHRSRIRGRRLSGLFIIMKVILAVSAKRTGTLTTYDIGSVLFFIMCYVAFIIVRDGKFEKEMRRRHHVEMQRMREKRKLEKTAARKKLEA